MRSLWKLSICIVLMLLIGITVSPSAQGAKTTNIDLGGFIKELLLFKLDRDTAQLALWMPFEFFVAAGASEGATWEEAANPDYSRRA